MSRFFSILIFLVYKAAEVSVAWYFLVKFNMRHGPIVYALYGGLSLFQLVFVTVQSLISAKNAGREGMVFRYTTMLTVLMDLLVLAVAGAYLFLTENSLYNLFFILCAVTPLTGFFYLFHTLAFSGITKKSGITVTNASFLPALVLLLATNGIPLGYFVMRFLKDKLYSNEEMLILGVLGANLLFLTLFWLRQFLKARRAAFTIRGFSRESDPDKVSVDDPNEFGFIASELKNLAKAVKKGGDGGGLLNGYVSKNIRDGIAKNGINQNGESKNASLACLKYRIEAVGGPAENAGISPENYLRLTNAITRIVGEFCDEYDAYPVFQNLKAFAAFGVPFFFEHQSLNAVEFSQKVIQEIERLALEENVLISAHIGICSGGLLTGPVASGGAGKNEYALLGEGVETAEKIAHAAENVKAKIIACNATMEKLKNKFYIDKSYKIRIKGEETLVVHEVRA